MKTFLIRRVILSSIELHRKTHSVVSNWKSCFFPLVFQPCIIWIFFFFFTICPPGFKYLKMKLVWILFLWFKKEIPQTLSLVMTKAPANSCFSHYGHMWGSSVRAEWFSQSSTLYPHRHHHNEWELMMFRELSPGFVLRPLKHRLFFLHREDQRLIRTCRWLNHLSYS